MKLMIDERLKYRLIGFAVIVSIGTFIAPVLIKKSSHRFAETISTKLPPKPMIAKLAMPEKPPVFQSMQVAHVHIPENKPIRRKISAESRGVLKELKAIAVIATKDALKSDQQLKVAQKIKSPEINAKVKKINKLTSPTKIASSYIFPLQHAKIHPAKIVSKPLGANYYAVQLGTFSQQKNALGLVNKLKAKGYLASFDKVTIKNRVVYRVIVGQLSQKQQAIVLQQRLAHATQLQGFIINTRIS